MTLPAPPAELAPLAQRLGAERLFALIEAHGGTRIHIARTPREGDDLVALIGLDAARALAAEWGATYLKVPLARAWYARCLLAQGLTQRQIARQMRVTENTVRLLVHGRRDERQMGLPL